ncbi:MAG TPA: hypothetical protein VF515_05705 [Candidatus Binatia bacterium]
MPVIVTYTPLQPPTRTPAKGKGRLLPHRCEDVLGHKHQQRLPLGSVRGILYLDALCLHCGAHFVWVEDDTAGAPESASRG